MKIFKRFLKKQQKIREGLVLAHTFANGERLWTYPDDKIHLVCIAHEFTINEYKNFLLLLNQSMHESKILAEKVKEKIQYILTTGDYVKPSTDILTLIEYQLTLPHKITEIENELKETLFCMFFLTDEEKPFVYDIQANAKKIRLLNTDLEQKAKFFFALQDTAKTLTDSWKQLEKIYLEGITEQIQALILLNTKKPMKN